MHQHADPDLLQTALLFLMTQHVIQGGRRELALAVIDHLDQLCLRLEALPPRLGRAMPRLREQWRVIAGGQGRLVPATGGDTPRASNAARSARVLRFPLNGRGHGR